MSVHKTEITEIILRKLQGKASVAEEEILEKWLEESPENMHEFQDFHKIWKNTEVAETNFPINVDEAWRKVQILANLGNTQAPSKIGKQVGFLPKIWKVAAVFILLAGIGSIITVRLLSENKPIEILATNEVRDVALPDGTKVSLNKNSHLVYSKPFLSGKERKVQLTGEGFFNVHKNPEKPFIVEGKRTHTAALGTSFSVKTTDSVDALSVYTGKAAFYSKATNEKIVVEAGASIKYDKQGFSMAASDINGLAWKTKVLQFEDQSLKEVAADLEAYFDKQIEVSPDMQEQRFTGKFIDPDLKAILTVISISTNSTIQSSKNTSYTICKKEK